MPVDIVYPDGFSHAKYAQLRSDMARAGQPVPDQSMRGIAWHKVWSGWRTQLPIACQSALQYFSGANYGGWEAALLQAQHHRDAEYKKVGADIHSRKRVKISSLNTCGVLVVYAAKRGKYQARATWMETVNGKLKQRAVMRTISPGLRTQEQAIEEVKLIMLSGVAAENQRLKESKYFG